MSYIELGEPEVVDTSSWDFSAYEEYRMKSIKGGIILGAYLLIHVILLFCFNGTPNNWAWTDVLEATGITTFFVISIIAFVVGFKLTGNIIWGIIAAIGAFALVFFLAEKLNDWLDTKLFYDYIYTIFAGIFVAVVFIKLIIDIFLCIWSLKKEEARISQEAYENAKMKGKIKF